MRLINSKTFLYLKLYKLARKKRELCIYDRLSEYLENVFWSHTCGYVLVTSQDCCLHSTFKGVGACEGQTDWAAEAICCTVIEQIKQRVLILLQQSEIKVNEAWSIGFMLYYILFCQHPWWQPTLSWTNSEIVKRFVVLTHICDDVGCGW